MEGAPPEEYDWGSAVGERGPPLTGQLLDNTIAHVWEPHMHWLSGHPLSTKRPTDAASAGANHASGLMCAIVGHLTLRTDPLTKIGWGGLEVT